MAFIGKDGGFSLGNFAYIFRELASETSKIREAFRNTFITFGVLVLMFPFKVLLSYFIYKKVPGYSFYRIVFFFPTIIFSVATALVFQQVVGVESAIAKGVQEWMGLSYTPELLADSRFANATIIGQLIWFGLPGDLIIWGGTFARIPEDVLESGRIDGTNWWSEFTKIIIPLVWPTVSLQMVLLVCGIFGASGAVFLLTGGEYGTMTIPSWMYITLLNSTAGGNMGDSHALNDVSAFGFLISSVAIIISLTVRRWTDKAFANVEF